MKVLVQILFLFFSLFAWATPMQQFHSWPTDWAIKEGCFDSLWFPKSYTDLASSRVGKDKNGKYTAFLDTGKSLYVPLFVPSCRGPVFKTNVENEFLQVLDDAVYRVFLTSSGKPKWKKIGSFSLKGSVLLSPRIAYSKDSQIIGWVGFDKTSVPGMSENVLIIWDLQKKKSIGPIVIGNGYQMNSAAVIDAKLKEIVVVAGTGGCIDLTSFHFDGTQKNNYLAFESEAEKYPVCNTVSGIWKSRVNLGIEKNSGEIGVFLSDSFMADPIDELVPYGGVIFGLENSNQQLVSITSSRSVHCDHLLSQFNVNYVFKKDLLGNMAMPLMGSFFDAVGPCEIAADKTHIYCERGGTPYYFVFDPQTKMIDLSKSYYKAYNYLGQLLSHPAKNCQYN